MPEEKNSNRGIRNQRRETRRQRSKKLVHQGNIRRITIKNKEGKSLIEIPLSIGVVGALLLPTLAAIGAIDRTGDRVHDRGGENRRVTPAFNWLRLK